MTGQIPRTAKTQLMKMWGLVVALGLALNGCRSLPAMQASPTAMLTALPNTTRTVTPPTTTAFFYITICFAILLPFSILKYLIRQKYTAYYDQYPDAKKKMFRYNQWFLHLLRIFLWLSPLFVILLPWLLSKYSDQNGLIVFIVMIMMIVNVLMEYRFRKWLVTTWQNQIKPDQLQ